MISLPEFCISVTALWSKAQAQDQQAAMGSI